jgi:hypothetical protein
LIVRTEHRKTFPSSRIAETLLMFLRRRGDVNAAMNSAAVYGPLADFYELSEQDRTLRTGDYYTGKVRAGLAWESEVTAAAKTLSKDGYLLSENNSGKLIWRLTPSGVERADFWLVRMTAKAAALGMLKVEAGLDAGDVIIGRAQA